MDFSALDLRKASNREYWVHLRSGDTLLYRDMDKQEGPCRAKVASISKPGVDEAVKAVVLAAQIGAECVREMGTVVSNSRSKELAKRHAEIDKMASQAIKTFLMMAIVDWENIEQDGKLVPFTREQLDDWSEKGAPLHRIGFEIAGDVAEAMSPFSQHNSA